MFILKLEYLNDSIEKKLENIKSINVLMKETGKFFYEYFEKNKMSISNSIGIRILFTNDTYDRKTVGLFCFDVRGKVYLENDYFPSMHCKINDLDVDFLKNIGLKDYPYSFKELRCINANGNNYKKYVLLPTEDLTSDKTYIKYGSIDVPLEKCREVKYPKYMYYILYYEKLSKGYKDLTNLLKDGFDSEINPNNISKIKTSLDENPSVYLYQILLSYSKNLVENVLVSTHLSVKQVEKARSLLEELKLKKTVKGFNTCLEKLMTLSPRKRDPFAGDKVKDFLATAPVEFEKIISFEENLIIAMETILGNENNSSKKQMSKENIEDIFKKLGIEVFLATESQKQTVFSHLSPRYQSMVKTVYRIKPLKQEEKFNNYIKENNITNIKSFWHGSVNSNWLSIIENSLIINKKVANGRMFGDGIYFAPSADKSFGYTSYSGSRWANGNDKVAIMGLYKTAYGNPLFDTRYYNLNQEELKKLNKNCLHARGGNQYGLRNDEIIFYTPDAVCLNYLVFFE